jgi:predicted HTH transcriptional regulator
LQTLKIVTNYQGRIVPTIGEILLFGADRLNHYPDAWIQAGRFAGNDRRRILDSTEVRAYLPGAAEEVIAFLRKHMTREAVIGPVKQTDRRIIRELAAITLCGCPLLTASRLPDPLPIDGWIDRGGDRLLDGPVWHEPPDD